MAKTLAEVLAAAAALKSEKQKKYTFVKASPDFKEVLYLDPTGKKVFWSTDWIAEQIKIGNATDTDGVVTFKAVEKDRSWAE